MYKRQGHNGMVGSAIVRKLKSLGVNDEHIITKNRNELDLTNQQTVNSFFNSESISFVFLAAAKVGGIIANNSMPAEFIYQNILVGIQYRMRRSTMRMRLKILIIKKLPYHLNLLLNGLMRNLIFLDYLSGKRHY